MGKALLIGNGINRINKEAFDWKGLLRDLAYTANAGIVPELNDFKPLPLFLEEIALVKMTSYKDTIRKVKERVNLLMSKIEPNVIHELIIHSKISDILTTNYDYGFEKIFDRNYMNQYHDIEQTQETKHSLKRKKTLPNGTTLWHIHGELFDEKGLNLKRGDYPEMSIMIGYEHYSDYLMRIQDHLYKLRKDGSKKKSVENTWVDIFLSQDVVICGLDLSFFEHHLWWLLNDRAIRIKDKKDNPPINNKIIYLYPDFPPPDLDKITLGDINKYRQRKACIDLLGAMNVKTIPIEVPDKDYKTFYLRVIEDYLN